MTVLNRTIYIIKNFEKFTNNNKTKIFIFCSFFLVFGIELLKVLDQLLPFFSVDRNTFKLFEKLTIGFLLIYCLLVCFLQIYNLNNSNRSRTIKILKDDLKAKKSEIKESIKELREEYKKNKIWLNKTSLEFLYSIGTNLFVIAICLTSISMLFDILNLSAQITNTLSYMGVLFSFVAIIMIAFPLGMDKILLKSILNACFPKKNKIISILPLKNRHIINSPEDYNKLIFKNKNEFGRFLEILEKWKPKDFQKEQKNKVSTNKKENRQKEKYYVEQFKKRLNSNKARRNLYEINKEVGLKLENGKIRRADIIINDNILIEAKSSDTASDIQRARGQIQEYAKAWNNKGPIILLLFDYTAKDAEDFQEAMEKLWDDGFQAITILAKEKKSG